MDTTNGKLISELAAVINKYGIDKVLGFHDFVIASMVLNWLNTLDQAAMDECMLDGDEDEEDEQIVTNEEELNKVFAEDFK